MTSSSLPLVIVAAALLVRLLVFLSDRQTRQAMPRPTSKRFRESRVHDSDTGWSDVESALDDALTEVDRAHAAGMRLLDGDSARPMLARLRESLEETRKQVRRGTPQGSDHFIGLVRWVVDWIPGPEHPLAHAVGRVARLAQEAEINAATVTETGAMSFDTGGRVHDTSEVIEE